MRQLKGKVHNINKTIIGTAIKKRSYFQRKKDKIFVAEEYAGKQFGFDYIVTESEIENNLFAGVSGVKNVNNICEGDIITIDTEGNINIVYEINSAHNALFITERCNVNCIMCSQPPVNDESSRLDLVLKHISLLPSNTESVGVTGGEPTLLGTEFINLIDALIKQLPQSHINILSNGIKFSEKIFTQKFAQVINTRTIVDIPLHSDIDIMHNRIVGRKAFYDTVKGLYNLAKHNIKIGIRIVIHKLNYQRLPELAEFIYRNFPFVYHIAFMQLEPIGNAKKNIELVWIDPLDYNTDLEEAVNILYYRGMHVSIYNSQLCVLSEKMHKFAVDSISEWKKIYIAECEECSLKAKCPGLFASSDIYHSRGIKSKFQDSFVNNQCFNQN